MSPFFTQSSAGGGVSLVPDVLEAALEADGEAAAAAATAAATVPG